MALVERQTIASSTHSLMAASSLLSSLSSFGTARVMYVRTTRLVIFVIHVLYRNNLGRN